MQRFLFPICLLALPAEQPKKKSPILIQNHGDQAWFRNLRVRPL